MEKEVGCPSVRRQTLREERLSGGGGVGGVGWGSLREGKRKKKTKEGSQEPDPETDRIPVEVSKRC